MSTAAKIKTPPIKPLFRTIGAIVFAVLFAVVATVLVVENVKGGSSSAATGQQVADKVVTTFAVNTGTVVVSSIGFSPEGEPQLGVPYPLNPSVYPSNATDPTLKWSSSNGDAATVDDKGVVTFHQYAGVTIVARSAMSTDVERRIALTCAPPPNDFAADIPSEINLYTVLYPVCYPIVDGETDQDKPSTFIWCEWEWDEEYFYFGDLGFCALKAGETRLVASRDGFRHEYPVTILDAPFVAPTDLAVYVDSGGKAASTNLLYGHQYTLQVTAQEGATFVPQYRSLTPKIVKTSLSGSMQGIAEGKGKIEVTNLYDPSFRYVVNVSVRRVNPTAINVVGPEKAGMDTTTRYYVQAVGFYTSGGDSVTWSSSDPKIAEVDEKGQVTVHRFGNVTITATSVLDPSLSGSYRVKCTLIGNFVKWVRKILGHFMGNAALGFCALGLLWFAYRRHRFMIAPATIVIGVFTSLLGEFLQLPEITAGRYGSFEDALINFSGFLLGALFCALVMIVSHLVRRARWLKATAPKEPEDLLADANS